MNELEIDDIYTVNNRTRDYYDDLMGESFVNRMIKSGIGLRTIQEFIYCCDCIEALMAGPIPGIGSDVFLLTSEWRIHRYGSLLTRIHESLLKNNKNLNPITLNFKLGATEYNCSFIKEKKKWKAGTFILTNLSTGGKIETIMND